jgi:hypothetical protein
VRQRDKAETLLFLLLQPVLRFDVDFRVAECQNVARPIEDIWKKVIHIVDFHVVEDSSN